VGTDVRGARIVQLLEDPLVGGDLLLVAVGLAAKYDFGLGYDGKLNTLAELLWSTHPLTWGPHWKIRDVFRQDIRTYKPPRPQIYRCTAPMVRRDGLCGRNATMSGYLTDWATGEKTYAGGCRRHYDWFNAQHKANWQAQPDLVPLPCANHGGALRVHFPKIDWPAFWRKLDPTWVEHPEAHAWPKPDLQLVLGDADDGTTSDRRPLLSVVPVGGDPQ
jgi:hypothetical protein